MRRWLVPPLLAGLMGGGSCGGSTALDPTGAGGLAGNAGSGGGSGGATEAGNDAGADSADARPLADVGGPALDTLPGVCTPGLDQTCNDDPTVSATLGVCDADGRCRCWHGMIYNPPSGRCLARDKCSEFPLGDWPANATLDVADCKSRPAFACLDTNPPQNRLGYAIGQLIRQPCRWGSYEWVRVEFVDGCARLVSARSIGPRSLQPLVDCVAQVLNTVRLSCAEDMACATVEYDLLP